MKDEPFTRRFVSARCLTQSLLYAKSRTEMENTMKTLIIAESKHCGNTRKVAEAMASAVSETIITDTAHIGEYNLHDFDLVGFGSGIYMGNFDRRIIRLVESFCDEPAKAFVFSTCGAGKIQYNQKLVSLLEDRNKTVIGSFCCKGLDKVFILRLTGGINKGCPTKEDLDRAGRFLKELEEKL